MTFATVLSAIEQQLQFDTNRPKRRVRWERYKYYTEERPVTIGCAECPQPSTLVRKWTIATNNPPTGKCSCKSTNQNKAAASIKPQQRIVEFKVEHLCVSSGKLFCNAYREEVNLKKSSVKNHIRSVKHKNSKNALKAKIKREKSISEAIQQHNSEVHHRRETLPMEHQVHCVNVVECFLRATVPLSKMQHFRQLLEETRYRLNDKHHMLNLIPVVLKQEKSRIQSEQDVLVIFNGTS